MWAPSERRARMGGFLLPPRTSIATSAGSMYRVPRNRKGRAIASPHESDEGRVRAGRPRSRGGALPLPRRGDDVSPMAPLPPVPPALLADLRRLVPDARRLLVRPIDRVAWASDASCYRLVPLAVVLARDVEEVRALFTITARHGV